MRVSLSFARRAGSLALLLALGCSSPPPPATDGGATDDGGDGLDGGADGGPPIDAPACAAPDPFPIGDPNGAATPLAAPAGEVRAGRIHTAELPPDPDDLATWRDGDYVLANERFAFVVSQPENHEVYDPYGGRVRGMARIEGGALVAPADFNLAMLGIARYVVGTDSVTVMSDGSDGGRAVVRARGPLAPIEALGPLLEQAIRADLDGWVGALDYSLSPGDDFVEVSLSIRRGSGRSASIPFVTAAFFQSFRMPSWTEQSGFVAPMMATPFVAFEDQDATSYAWAAVPQSAGGPGELSLFLSTSGFDFYTTRAGSVPACTEQRFVLGRFVVGETDGMNGVQRVLWRERGEVTRTVTGTLTSSDPAAIAGAHVHVTNTAGDVHYTRAVVDASGAFDLVVPADAGSVWVWREGAPLEGPFAIPASGPMTIPLAQLATLSIDVTDGMSGAPIPARVQTFPVGTAPAVAPEAFGERELGRGRNRMEFAPVSGHVDVRVAPGTYRLVVSHGWEMETHDQMLTLAAGETRAIAAPLARAFDTPGLMCADYHIHTHRSVDSEDSGRLKVSALAADGLEIAIRSDHEWVDDFGPVVHDLGLDDVVLGLAGEELTTFVYGHFGVFPLEVDRTRPSSGAVTWFDRLAPEVFAEVRSRPESPLLIINHPRAGGIRQGYFNEAGYNRTTGIATHPENWDETFDVVEVINSSSFENNRGETVADWFSLLNAGRHVMMVGSSDSHHTHGDPVGYPRTCLWIGQDDVHAIDGDMVRDVTHAGTSFVTGGIYLTVTGPGGVRPGASASGVGMRTQIHVVVQAPSFIDVDQLEVIVDGTTTETIPITAPVDPTETLRFEGDVDVDVAASGSWVVIHASGTDTPDIAYGGQPFGVTNPIFLTR